MGCNCGGSGAPKTLAAQEVAARRAAAAATRPAQGPKAPGYYSGPDREQPAPAQK